MMKESRKFSKGPNSLTNVAGLRLILRDAMGSCRSDFSSTAFRVSEFAARHSGWKIRADDQITWL